MYRAKNGRSAAMASLVALALAAPGAAHAADPIKAEIVDNWGTGAERAAVQVIQDALRPAAAAH